MIADIMTMRGITPRVEDYLLPDEAATVATDCQFDHGSLAPMMADKALGVSVPVVPQTLFHYSGNFWFAWSKVVEVMRSPIAQDQYQRVYWTDGEYPKLTYNAIATGGTNKPTAWHRLGVPAPGTPPSLISITPPSGGNDDTATDDETRFYVETYVSGLGEEGAPGPASVKITIPIPNSTVVIGLSPAPTNDSNITRRRVYRSVSGGGVADYLLVADLPIATTTLTDAHKEGELGPVLETYDYAMPPSGLRGLCQMANGICVGFVGNAIYFSEPYLPYAWPEKYRLTTEHDIVAIAAIDTALVVGTKGCPYLVQGASPSSMTSQKLSHIQQACVSARSMVALDGMVLYAAPDGLVGVGSEGGQLVTDSKITRKQWQAMKPDTLRAWYHEGSYVALTDSSAFVFDTKAGDFVTISGQWDAAYHDMLQDALILAKGKDLYQWRGADVPLSMVWQSKAFVTPPGVRLSCAKVRSKNAGAIALSVIVDGVDVLSLPIGAVPDAAFRLPAVRGRKWQVRVSGTSDIERITLASSMSEVNAI